MKKAVGLVLCVAVAVLTSSSFLGGARVAAAPQQSAFRASTQLVEIDVRVTDRGGRFITGLSQDEFEVLEDGTPQQIAQFSFVTLPTSGAPVERRGPDASVAQADGEAPVAGRTFVMLLDGPSGRNGVPRMRSAARLFLDHMFRPTDQMAVTFVRGKFLKYLEGREHEMIEQPFTTDRRAIEAAVDRLAPDTMSGDSSEGSTRTYEAMEAIAIRLGSMGGGRKMLVWVGGRVPFNPAEDRRGPAIAVAYRNAIRAANRRGVAIYPVDLEGLTTRMTSPPRGLTTLGGLTSAGAELKRMAALRVVADDTGGEAVVGTNNYAEMFARIASHSGTYYLLAYRPAVEHCDGRFHAITVRVKRADASVRARRGYYAPEPGDGSAAQDIDSPAAMCQ